MKIRSVTIFNGKAADNSAEAFVVSGHAAALVRARLENAGFQVQTTRLALAPANVWNSAIDTVESVARVKRVERAAREAGIDYISLGPAVAHAGDVANIERLAELAAATQAVFFSAEIGDVFQNVLSWALMPVAKAVQAVSRTTENGFDNLRFAALAHCPPGIPFFPAAYARFGEFSFALAIECADLALQTALQHANIVDAMAELTQRIEHAHQRIEAALAGIDAECGIAFNGVDWSLAPHPDAACSIGAALEKLSGSEFGQWGTLTAVAALTRAIRKARVRHVGFSGVFLPLLEDAVLARRIMNVQDLQKLVLYSAVCGTGLDTIPLAGDVSEQSIAALLSDVATLAAVLKKPLTARLMPIPQSKAGDETAFDFPFLVNARIVPLQANAPGVLRSTTIGFGL